MNNVDVCYLTFALESNDQAVSLASYLNRHGYNATADLNEVVCPLVDDVAETTADLHQLKNNWRKYWQHEDAALFRLPVFVKDDCCS